MSDLEIMKTLVLSTGHVSKETAEFLDACGVAGNFLIVTSVPFGDYGWLVPTCAAEEGGCPADLKVVLEFAARHDCTWVRLDCDGNRIDDLPSWEW